MVNSCQHRMIHALTEDQRCYKDMKAVMRSNRALFIATLLFVWAGAEVSRSIRSASVIPLSARGKGSSGWRRMKEFFASMGWTWS